MQAGLGKYCVHLLADYITSAAAPPLHAIPSQSAATPIAALQQARDTVEALTGPAATALRQGALALYGACSPAEVRTFFGLRSHDEHVTVLSDCQKVTCALARYDSHIGDVQGPCKHTTLLLGIATVCIEGTHVASFSILCLVYAVTTVTHIVCNYLGVSSSCLDCCCQSAHLSLPVRSHCYNAWPHAWFAMQYRCSISMQASAGRGVGCSV